MKSIIYSTCLLLTIILFAYGILGILGTAVSYKYEINDPTVEITLQKLAREGQRSEYSWLKEKKNQLELQEYLFSGLIIFSVAAFILLIYFRKRILQK